jgi:hypothetical protein
MSMLLTRNNNPINAGLVFTPGGLARGEILEIGDECTWLKDFSRMMRD